jgi:predicted nucleic acid-binding Zn ribbon protein
VTDIFDQATELEEKQREIALSFRNPTLTPCGACYNCGEALSGTMVLCGSECREDFDARQRMKQREGKL